MLKRSCLRRAPKSIIKASTTLDKSIEKDDLISIRAAECINDLDGRARLELVVRRWRLIHKCLHHNPLAPDPALPRAEQWRQILDYAARDVAEPELNAWIGEQIAVAENLAKGVQDMRPRKSGPVHALLLEWVSDRKHKAHTVLKWNNAAWEAAQDADDEPHWKPTGGRMDRSKPRKAPAFSPGPDLSKPDKRY